MSKNKILSKNFLNQLQSTSKRDCSYDCIPTLFFFDRFAENGFIVIADVIFTA